MDQSTIKAGGWRPLGRGDYAGWGDHGPVGPGKTFNDARRIANQKAATVVVWDPRTGTGYIKMVKDGKDLKAKRTPNNHLWIFHRPEKRALLEKNRYQRKLDRQAQAKLDKKQGGKGPKPNPPPASSGNMVTTLQVAGGWDSFPLEMVAYDAQPYENNPAFGSYEAYYDAKGRIVWLQKQMELWHAPRKPFTNDSMKIHAINKFSVVFDRMRPLVKAVYDGRLGPVCAKNLRNFIWPNSFWLQDNPKVVPCVQNSNVKANNEYGGRWGGYAAGHWIMITIPYFVEDSPESTFESEVVFMVMTATHEMAHWCDSVPYPHDDIFYKKLVNIQRLAVEVGTIKPNEFLQELGYNVKYDIHGNHMSGNIDPTVPRPQ
jgi:hypothetical protein